jgi:hypothetical protein
VYIVCENATTALAAGIKSRKWREIYFSSMICAPERKIGAQVNFNNEPGGNNLLASGTFLLEPESDARAFCISSLGKFAILIASFFFLCALQEEIFIYAHRDCSIMKLQVVRKGGIGYYFPAFRSG